MSKESPFVTNSFQEEEAAAAAAFFPTDNKKNDTENIPRHGPRKDCHKIFDIDHEKYSDNFFGREISFLQVLGTTKEGEKLCFHPATPEQSCRLRWSSSEPILVQSPSLPRVAPTANTSKDVQADQDTATITTTNKVIAQRSPSVSSTLTAPLLQPQQQQPQKQETGEPPLDFSPKPWPVIIGRDKQSLETPGNKRLHVIIQWYMERYAKTTGKAEKSKIISEIMATVQSGDPVDDDGRGTYIKYCEYSGKWCQVTEETIRVKIGRLLREALHTKYRSSSKSKRARRRRVFCTNTSSASTASSTPSTAAAEEEVY